MGADRAAASSRELGIGVGDGGPGLLHPRGGEQQLPRHRRRRRREPRRRSGQVAGLQARGRPGAAARRRSADVFFIWDPDGDRFNMVTTAPADLAAAAAAAGPRGRSPGRRPLPGLLQAQPDLLHADGGQDRRAGRGGRTGPLRLDRGHAPGPPAAASARWPSSVQPARGGAGLATFRVPVGFKHFAALVTRSRGSDRRRRARPLRAADVTGHAAPSSARGRAC